MTVSGDILEGRRIGNAVDGYGSVPGGPYECRRLRMRGVTHVLFLDVDVCLQRLLYWEVSHNMD